MSLADTIWWTKKSLIKAEKRLLAYDFFFQIVLLWYSLFTVGFSIYELKFGSKNEYSGVIMISLTVLILCASLFTTSRNFKERAMLIKQCYVQLNTLYVMASNNKNNIGNIAELYQSTLKLSETHEDIDFKKALIGEYLNTNHKEKLTRLPTTWNWIEVVVWYFYRTILALLLSSAPFIIFLLLKNPIT